MHAVGTDLVRGISRRHRGLYWVAVLLSVAVIATGGVVAWSGYVTNTGADGAVLGYFAALRRGDAPAALAYGDLPSGSHLLLTGDVLKEQQAIAPIGDVSVTSVVQDTDGASVAVHYELEYPSGPHPVSTTLRLSNRSGRWHLSKVAIPTTLTLPRASQRATVVQTPVPSGPTLLFPGVVPIRLDTPYLELDPASSSVDFSVQGATEVGIRITTKGRDAARSAVRGALAKCLTETSPATACPLPSTNVVPGSFTGTLHGDWDQSLQFTVTDSAVGVIRITGKAEVDGTYDALNFENVAKHKAGNRTLTLDASVYAVPPARATWTVAR